MCIRDRSEVQDVATYAEPQQYSLGTVHVLVNGMFSIKDGQLTSELAGRPLMRGGQVFGTMD